MAASSKRKAKINATPSPVIAPAPRNTKELWLAALLCAMLVTAVFGKVLLFDFVNLDDNSNLKKSPAMQDVTLAWSKPFLDAYLPLVYTVWNGVHHVAQVERPVGDTIETWTPLPQLNPLPFHALNLLLHIMNGLLVFLLGRTLFTQASALSLGVVTALFLVHPLQVEPVAWVTALKDVMSATFSLLLCWLYCRKPLSNKKGVQDWSYTAALALVFIAACFSKSTRIFLPLFLVFLGRLHWQKSWPRLIGELLPLFLLAFVLMLTAMLVQPTPGDNAYQQLWHRPLVATDALAFYVIKLVWPLHLALDYGRNPRFLFESGQAYWTWLLPVTLCVAWWFLRHRINAWLQVGLAGFVLSLLPLLGLQPFMFQTISSVSDRYCYLSIALLLLGCVPLLEQVAITQHRIRRTVIMTTLMIIIAVSAWLSTQQLSAWKNSAALWQHTLQVTPDSGIAHNNLASIYEELGQTGPAIEHYTQALTRLPRADICARIGILYSDQHNPGAAYEWFSRGLELEPDNTLLLLNRSVMSNQLGNTAQARSDLMRLLAIQPNNPQVRQLLQSLNQ